MPDGVHEMSLRFETIECRCGEWRPRGVACTCGKIPDEREVDQALARRQRIISKARDLRDLHGTPVSKDWTELPEELGSAVTSAMEALSLAASTIDEVAAAAQLGAALGRLRGVCESVDRVRELRPLLAARRSLKRVALTAREAIELWTSALERPLPLDAQNDARKAQARLDQATAEAAELGGQLDAITRRSKGEPGQVLSLIAGRAGEAWSRGDPLPPVASDLVRADADRNLRLMLYFQQEDVEAGFDEARFWDIASRVHREISGQPFNTLIENTHWSDAYSRQMAALEDARRIAEIVAEHTTEPRLAQRTEINHFVSAVEATARFALRTRLTLTRSAEWNLYERKTLGPLLELAVAEGWQTDLDGLETVARNAFTHCDYDLNADDASTVVLDPGTERETRLTWDEFENLKLECLESASAMLFGITLALVERDADTAARASIAAIPVAALAQALHSALGMAAAGVELIGGKLTITYEQRLPNGLVSAAYGTADLLAQRVESIEYRSPSEDLCLPVAALPDAVSDRLDIMDLIMAIQLDGRPLGDADFIRRLAAAEALESRSSPRRAMTRLRRIRSALNAIEDEQGVQVVTSIMAACRRALTDGGHLVLPSATLECLRSWSRGEYSPHRLLETITEHAA